MKNSNRGNQAIAASGAWCSLNTVFRERKVLPLTASEQWRKAAELLAPNTRTADCCWRQ